MTWISPKRLKWTQSHSKKLTGNQEDLNGPNGTGMDQKGLKETQGDPKTKKNRHIGWKCVKRSTLNFFWTSSITKEINLITRSRFHNWFHFYSRNALS